MVVRNAVCSASALLSSMTFPISFCGEEWFVFKVVVVVDMVEHGVFSSSACLVLFYSVALCCCTSFIFEVVVVTDLVKHGVFSSSACYDVVCFVVLRCSFTVFLNWWHCSCVGSFCVPCFSFCFHVVVVFLICWSLGLSYSASSFMVSRCCLSGYQFGLRF